jgi:hypothetical protein
MLGDVTAPEQNRPGRRRERCQEPRQALKVRTCGGGQNVAPLEVGDHRIPVAEYIAASLMARYPLRQVCALLSLLRVSHVPVSAPDHWSARPGLRPRSSSPTDDHHGAG